MIISMNLRKGVVGKLTLDVTYSDQSSVVSLSALVDFEKEYYRVFRQILGQDFQDSDYVQLVAVLYLLQFSILYCLRIEVRIEIDF